MHGGVRMKDADRSPADIATLLDESGGSYAAALGIALDGLRAEEIYRWFIAAVLYGAPIPEALASRTWREFSANGVLDPQRVLDTGWDGLVQMLDRGGYTRYDYKTATKLLEINRALLTDYGGDLNALHAAAADPADLQRRLMALGKGIGPATAAIFLRELRGRWQKAAPPLSPLAIEAARELGFLPRTTAPDAALRLLQERWRQAGMSDDTFRDFEAALVRMALRKRHTPRRAQ